tara:strand:+ start:3894 stop:4424 length:531 start_codon:yes stop_codon:yes gene_type:complete
MNSKGLNIRAVADTQEDIFIDFAISKRCNFSDIHHFLISKFNLNKLELSSFYYSNDNWDKGEEITLMNMNFDDENNIKFMDMVLLKDVYKEGHLKFLYVNDFLNMNIFYLEILKEVDVGVDEKVNILHQLGEYKPNNQNIEEKTIEDDTKNEIDEILKEYDEDDFNKFEELDDDLY